jgi:hypothetical protein
MRLASGRVPAMPFEPSAQGRSLEPRFDHPTARNSCGGDSSFLRTGIAISEPDYLGAPVTPR